MRHSLALIATAACLLATPALADDCLDQVKLAMDNAMNSGPMHMETQMTGANVMTMSGDIIPPSNMHAKVNAGGQEIEVIVLDGSAWMNLAGAWQQLPPEAAAQMTAGFNMASSETLNGATELTCETATVDGRELLSYSWKLDVDNNNTVNTALVDPATKTPSRITSEITTDGAVTSVIVEYRYDPSITITAPAL